MVCNNNEDNELEGYMKGMVISFSQQQTQKQEVVELSSNMNHRKSCMKRSKTLSLSSMGSSTDDSSNKNDNDVINNNNNNKNNNDIIINKKTVTFSSIKIIEFPMILGDNPSADGIPIQIDWISQQTIIYDNINEFENKRSKKRDTCEMLIPNEIRKSIILRTGDVTTNNIQDVLNEIKQIKLSRIKSIRDMKWDNINERIEWVKNKVNNKKQQKQRRRRHILLGGGSGSGGQQQQQQRRRGRRTLQHHPQHGWSIRGPSLTDTNTATTTTTATKVVCGDV